MFAIPRIPISIAKKGRSPLSINNADCGFPELPQLSTSDDYLQSELPILPISATGEASPEFESPAVVVEQSHLEPEPTTMSTMKENCFMCPFGTFCQDKLQCSAFLTGFGEQIIQSSETSIGDGSGQKLFELMWSKRLIQCCSHNRGDI